MWLTGVVCGGQIFVKCLERQPLLDSAYYAIDTGHINLANVFYTVSKIDFKGQRGFVRHAYLSIPSGHIILAPSNIWWSADPLFPLDSAYYAIVTDHADPIIIFHISIWQRIWRMNAYWHDVYIDLQYQTMLLLYNDCKYVVLAPLDRLYLDYSCRMWKNIQVKV